MTTASTTNATTALPAAAPIAPDKEVGESVIRFLEDRVKGDPDDIVAQNRLGGLYLQRLRETGNLTYLGLASRAAQASLKSVPSEVNGGGLGLLAQTEFAAHHFAATRDHAQRLTQAALAEGRKPAPYQWLGDAQLELGEYENATATFKRLALLAPNSMGTLVRQARLAALYGKHAEAQRLYSDALATALAMTPPERETVAWCRWQLGEHAFNAGDYAAAEKQYRDALTTFPDYYRALHGLGRTLAVRGAFDEAITQLEKAVRQLPDPALVALLGDVYQRAERATEAATQYQLYEQLARLGQANGDVYNRQRALFYADHDLHAAEAYTAAQHEYAARRDIYGADALAWTAFKAGHLAEAQAASKEALRLGTQDAKLFYHAGLIARANGDRVAARAYLQQAHQLNPQFDPLQAVKLAQALAE